MLMSAPLAAGLMLAQSQQTPAQTSDPASSTASAKKTASDQSMGKPMMGILVDSGCASSNMAKTTAASTDWQKTPMASSDMKPMTNDTSGQSQRAANDNRRAEVQPPPDQSTTGEANRSAPDTQYGNNAKAGGDPSMTTAELADNPKWDHSCFIGTKTTSFSFQTHDGRTLKFDSASNDQIKSQLDSTSRVATKNKIFRARVNGTVDGDTIHLTNITM